MNRKFYATLAPGIFVLLWSTGFLGAIGVSPYAEPFTILSYRFIIVLGFLLVFVTLLQKNQIFKLSFQQILGSLLVGVFLHGLYLGGVFAAVRLGQSGAISALIVGLQPIITMFLGWLWLKEKLGLQAIIGLMLGLLGVSIAIFGENFQTGSQVAADGQSLIENISFLPIVLSIIGLLGICVSTVFQRKFKPLETPIWAGMFWQYLGAFIFAFILSLIFETREVIWSGELIVSLLWLAIILSLGSVFLLMWLIKHNAAGRVASLFYLVPIIVAIETWLIFDQQLTPLSIGGLVITSIGVWVILRDQQLKAQ